MNSNVGKYLSRWAEPSARPLAEALSDRYFAALGVPLLGESHAFLEGYRAAARQAPGRVLIVAVVNATVATAPELRAQNGALLQQLCRGARALSEHAFFERHAEFDLLTLDRSSPGRELPERQGVGLARKIAGDLLLAMFERGALDLPFLLMTDADATLPADYFARAERERARGPAALIYPFRHVPGVDPEVVHHATQLYEALIRYHVLGLAWAGSAYAYHSIGSTLAVHVDAYAGVRGVPKRAAGEDFYLLDKLGKLGPIRKLDGAPVAIASRRSARVPFGTGPRVEQLLNQRRALVASDQAFLALKHVLLGLDRVAASSAPAPLAETLKALPPALAAQAAQVIEELGLPAAMRAAIEQVGQGNLRRRLHTWFDALKTLQFLHLLRDRGVSELELTDALSRAPFCPAGDPTLEATLERLRDAECRLPSELGPALL
ncbi:MAG TPA: hypothetical protein VG937_04000 [Polyangiaceae bacterium]|nr:hypothetical protein [Polyangiaceae bacterium]